MTIQPYSKNPLYWEYQGKPTVLLGGTVEDNVFQIANLEEHLNLLSSVGGNYVRCTMSSRDEGDVWAFLPNNDGIYDLEKPNTTYWDKFHRLLELAQSLEIIVQIEVWDRFDFARAPWQDNPYNPKNNHAYTAETSGLVEVIETHPGKRESSFFRSVPTLDNNTTLLPYQHQFVDWLLDISLDFSNVLYCMDNETNESPEWGKYWATYIQNKGTSIGKTVYTTEMWDAWDLSDPQHNATFDHPELYAFVDVSQNNHNVGLNHWNNLQLVRQRIADSGQLRPMNMVKIYGANTGNYGTHRDAQERFWRAIFGGTASARFHRPPSGIGLSDIAQAHLQSMRMFTDQLDITTCEPRLDLISKRSQNEAYCIAKPSEAYGIFFPDGGQVELLVDSIVPFTMDWLDIRVCRWLDRYDITPQDGQLTVKTPTLDGYWAVLIKSASPALLKTK